MTTRVFIRSDGGESTLEVYLVTVQTLAGRREVVGSKKALVLHPGNEATVYVHECQELRVVERKP